MRCPIVAAASTLCSLAVLAPATSTAQSPTREDILSFFLQANAQTNAPSAPVAPTTPPATDSLQPMLNALENLASKKPDDALLRALFEYQLAHPGAEDPRPALAFGRLYWAQPKAFLATFRSLDPPQQRRLMPYVEFGWKECIRGKVKSGRHFQQLQQDIDRLGASMINAR
ncbi:MAG TPA: hypothetical protein PLU30_23720 [Verrucomicrobiae bacterium]|nr:hypothetical protein [Verrucomicrobiae bacterium]